MELLEFEDEEENNALIDIDEDDNYDKTDLFSEEDDENYDLCSGCDENLFPTWSNQVDIWFVSTVSRKRTVNYVVSINSRSAEPTGDTENECATSEVKVVLQRGWLGRH